VNNDLLLLQGIDAVLADAYRPRAESQHARASTSLDHIGGAR